jgi:hypothetical protein
MKRLFILFFIVLAVQYGNSQQVTYAEQIAPIIYKHCATCHRSGEIAPFPLANYAEVKSHGSLIKYVTGIEYMPPWKPQKHLREYRNQNFLSADEIAQIAQWVDGGMPRGDISKEPPFPVFPSGSQIGHPDLVVSFAKKYLHKGNGVDEYRYFVIPTNLTEDKYLVGLEVRPGNTKVVHHTLIWADSTSTSRDADAATPEYGFEGSGSAVAGQLNNQLPGYVPGQKPILFTDGLAMRIPKGSDLLLQMHYAPSATDEWDSTSINLFFAKTPPTRRVESYVMLPIPGVLQNDVFIIPPNQVKQFHGKITLPFDVTFLGLAPHCHLLGKDWQVYAILPDGTRLDAININTWDFNWQGSYYFKKPLILPRGTEIHALATYDNTTDNPNNPNNPPKIISWGEKTSDEMYYLPLVYMQYKPGDENLYFDDIAQNNQASDEFAKDKLYPVYPNPASTAINIPFTLSRPGKVSLEVYDITGKLCITNMARQWTVNGMHNVSVNINQIPKGEYTVKLTTEHSSFVGKFIKQ